MIITWSGFACFKIEGENSTIIIDPFTSQGGLRTPAWRADIVITSSQDPLHNNLSAVRSLQNGLFAITHPGEYEIWDVSVMGFPVKGKNRESSIFFIDMENIRLVHLGALQAPLFNSQLEHLEKVDILFIPVGGGFYIDPHQAVEMINQINPRIVIPMCYRTSQKVKGLQDLSVFCKIVGTCPEERVKRFKVSRRDFPSDETRIVVLDVQ